MMAPSPRLGRQQPSPTPHPTARTQAAGRCSPNPHPRSFYGHLFVPEEVRQVLASAPYTQLQVTIRVCQPAVEQVQAAWEAFRQLRHDTVPGHLPASAVSYDRYLYSKKR